MMTMTGVKKTRKAKTMKILIEVSEKDYLNFMLQYDNGILDEKTPSHRAKIAIANGQILPKGHGRLIDGNRLKERIESEAVYADEQGKHDISDIFYRCGGMINTAHTFVEADKEGAEE